MASRICEPPPPPTSPCTRGEFDRDGRAVPSPYTITERINSAMHLIRSRGDQRRWHGVASLSDVEVKAMAGADPTHLRALIMPDYSRVATSFSELLLRVVRRCKRDSQVDARVLQACQALGVREERNAPAAVLAKRLRGLGLAWHSYSLEECQAFAEQELDGNGDGRITVPDVFVYLQNVWAAQRRHSLSFPRNGGNKGENLGRPHTLDDVHRGLGRRRTTLLRWRGTASQAPDGGGGFFPRSLAEKLIAAAGLARSHGVDVMKALQASLAGVGGTRVGVLGADATCFFLRTLRVDFDSSALRERNNVVAGEWKRESECIVGPDENRHHGDDRRSEDYQGLSQGVEGREERRTPSLKRSEWLCSRENVHDGPAQTGRGVDGDESFAADISWTQPGSALRGPSCAGNIWDQDLSLSLDRHKGDGGNTSRRLQRAAAELRRMEGEYLRLQHKMRRGMADGEGDSDKPRAVERNTDFCDGGDNCCDGSVPYDKIGGRGRIGGGGKHADAFEGSTCGCFSDGNSHLHDRSSVSAEDVEGRARGRHEGEGREHTDYRNFAMGVTTGGMSEQQPPRRGLVGKGEPDARAAMNWWGANRYDVADESGRSQTPSLANTDLDTSTVCTLLKVPY